MFDNDFSTYWRGALPVTEQNKVTVTFEDPVEFHGLYIVTRGDEKRDFAGSYQSMCLVLDGDTDGKICTSADEDVDVGDLLVLINRTTPVTQVELIIQNGETGQIADFKIHYKGTYLFFVFQSISLSLAI